MKTLMYFYVVFYKFYYFHYCFLLVFMNNIKKHLNQNEITRLEDFGEWVMGLVLKYCIFYVKQKKRNKLILYLTRLIKLPPSESQN